MQESSGSRPATARMDAAAISTSRPRGVRYGLPQPVQSSRVRQAVPVEYRLEALLQRLAGARGRVAEIELQLRACRGSRWSRRCRRGCSSTARSSAGSTRCRRPTRWRRARPSPARRGGSGCARDADRRCGPARPRTSAVPDSVPRRPFLIMSPSALDRRRLADDAVVDARRRPRRGCSTTRTVPSTAGPSSSEVSSSAIEPGADGCAATKASMAVTKAASEPFMSAAPRPYSQPSRSIGTNGSARPSCSTRAGRHDVGVPGEADQRARVAAARPEVGDAAGGDRLAANPSGARRAAISAWQPASSGVTDARAISVAGERQGRIARGRRATGTGQGAAGSRFASHGGRGPALRSVRALEQPGVDAPCR